MHTTNVTTGAHRRCMSTCTHTHTPPHTETPQVGLPNLANLSRATQSCKSIGRMTYWHEPQQILSGKTTNKTLQTLPRATNFLGSMTYQPAWSPPHPTSKLLEPPRQALVAVRPGISLDIAFSAVIEISLVLFILLDHLVALTTDEKCNRVRRVILQIGSSLLQ
jgi:hypothetical protein